MDAAQKIFVEMLSLKHLLMFVIPFGRVGRGGDIEKHGKRSSKVPLPLVMKKSILESAFKKVMNGVLETTNNSRGYLFFRAFLFIF